MAQIDAYQGIILDYGGVLVHDQSLDHRIRMAAITQIPLGRFEELYWSNLRFDHDKDVLTAEQYWHAVASQADVSLTPAQIEELIEFDVLGWMNYDPAMWEWLEELRAAGKRLAMLSNMPRELGEALRNRTRRLTCFDHVTLSYEIGAAKPEPLIYQECLAGIGTPADQTLFLDDRLVNIEAAEKLGIHARQFTSRQDVLPALLA